MERSRIRTLLGIGLIVLGVIFLSQALARPMLAPLQALPALPALPRLPALAPLPPWPALPPLPALPRLPVPHATPFLRHAGRFSPALVLIGLLVLLVVWHRRRACASAG
ncbi:MAG: hypothetical protein M3R61_04530 [Chloroflexota bacterium]|nr:hypothetical protein [Chloroflexota bacterium]